MQLIVVLWNDLELNLLLYIIVYTREYSLCCRVTIYLQGLAVLIRPLCTNMQLIVVPWNDLELNLLLYIIVYTMDYSLCCRATFYLKGLVEDTGNSWFLATKKFFFLESQMKLLDWLTQLSVLFVSKILTDWWLMNAFP